jgi:hypothetical protein
MTPLATRTEILQEIGRELSMRRDTFPQLVKEGKLKQDEADRRINRMQAGYEFIMLNMKTDK